MIITTTRKDSCGSGAAYRFYKSIMDQLIRIDKEYEIRMKNDQKRNHE